VYVLIGVRALSQLSTPLMKGLILRQFPAHQQGELFGVLSSLYTLTSFLGPLLFNSLFSRLTSTPTPWLTVIALVMDLLHTNGPGLIYYLVSGITLASLCVSCVVFCVWHDHTTLPHTAKAVGEEDSYEAGDGEDEEEAQKEKRERTAWQYQRVLVISKSSEPQAYYSAQTAQSVN
jgi:hypothetical protein